MLKQSIYVAIISFFTCISLSSADDKNCKDGNCHPSVRPVCFNVFCTFERDGASQYDKCQAASTFTHLVYDDGSEFYDNSSEVNNPTFEIQCDGNVLYNSSAHRYTDYLGTRIQAIPGPYPAIVLPQGALKEIRHYSEASLEFADQQIKGSCYLYTGPQ